MQERIVSLPIPPLPLLLPSHALPHPPKDPLSRISTSRSSQSLDQSSMICRQVVESNYCLLCDVIYPTSLAQRPLARKRVHGYGLMLTVNPSQVRSGSCKTKKTQTLLTVSMCSCEQEKLAQLISSQLMVCRKQKQTGPEIQIYTPHDEI